MKTNQLPAPRPLPPSSPKVSKVKGGSGEGGSGGRGVEKGLHISTFFVYTIRNFRAGESLAEHEAAVAASVIKKH